MVPDQEVRQAGFPAAFQAAALAAVKAAVMVAALAAANRDHAQAAPE